MEKQSNHFDVVVIGGGPGGYPAAIAASRNGASVALVEKELLGGTCLNWGCIPTKALVASASRLDKIRRASELGISVDGISFDFAFMADRKDKVVENLRKGVQGLITANNIKLFKGFGKFVSPNEIKVTGESPALLQADKVIIATGSKPKTIKAFPFDDKKILSSTSILGLRKLPKSLVIIGGGIIGCEFAALYSTFGVQVTILEALPTIIPMEAPNIISELSKAFTFRGVKIHTGVFVEGIDDIKKGVRVRIKGAEAVEADLALVAVGRELNTFDIGLEKAAVVLQDNGVISTNNRMETGVPGIYAVGDITGVAQLAHVATHQGIIAAMNATGHPMTINYSAIPSAMFTHPEIATVGLSLEKALANKIPATAGAFPFSALGKAQATGDTEGFAQIVINKETGQILGAQVVGSEASIMVAEMATAIANELTVECVSQTIHAHPTMPEAWMEAAWVALDAPLHLPPKRKKK